MDIKNDIKNFYDNEAKKYYHSRKKQRTDGKIILQEILDYKKKSVSILEFGCGWWRCISYLNENLKWIKINYTWVDLSKNLLSFAQKDNPNDKFICDDITHHIQQVKQESFDFIIWIASFQHIPSQKEREFLMKNFYKALKYNWKIILLNRSMSNRFVNKYTKAIITSWLKTIYTLWWHNFRDLFIPRNSWKKIEDRYYHIFSKKELWKLSKEQWYITEKLTYIDKYWHEIQDRRQSNNTILVWKKQVFL